MTADSPDPMDERKEDKGPAARRAWSKPAVWTLIVIAMVSSLSLTVLASVAIDKVTQESNINTCVRDVRNGTDKAKLDSADVTLEFLQDATDDGEISHTTRHDIKQVKQIVDDARTALDGDITECENRNGLFPW